MATRPSDWSALGLSDDPTPGDVDELKQVVDYLNQVAQATGTIETALQKVLGTSSSGNFVGATSTAMAGQISGRFINFMRDCSNAFATAHTAVDTYHTAMLAQQQIAGDALSKAQASGLKSDDPQVQAWAQTATQAGTDLTTASNTAANAVDGVSSGTQPISGWDMFWEALGWIALILLIPAIIVGGPLALIAFGLNLVLFIKAAVDFGEGKIGFGQFLLAFLGIIAPTTEGLNLAELLPAIVKGIGSAAKAGVGVIKGSLSDLMQLAKGFNFADVFSVDTLLAIGKFTYNAGLWVMHGIQDLPGLLANGALVTGKALGDFLGKVGTGIVHDLETGAWVRLVLPVKGDEVANLGLGGAFRLGVLERGLGVSADPVLALKMVAVNGLKSGGASSIKLWSVSSDIHFAANPDHGGIITPVGEKLVTPDITLNLHADPGTNPGGLTTVHTNVMTSPVVVTPTAHVMTPDAAMHGFNAPSLQVVGGNIGHGFTSDAAHMNMPGTNLTNLGNLGHGANLGHLGGADLSNLGKANTFTPTVTKLDLGSITTFSHTAQGHAGSVLDVRTPTEINNVFHGGGVVTHLDDFSIVIRDAGAPTAAMGHVDVGVGSSVTATAHLDVSAPLPVSGVDHLAFAPGSADAMQGHLANLQGLDTSVERVNVQAVGSGMQPIRTDFGHVAEHVDQTPVNVDHTAAASSSSSAVHLDHMADTAHDDAGVPGLLGLPADRVAVPWTDFKSAQHEYHQALDQYNAVHPTADAHGAESSAMGDVKGKAKETPAQAQADVNLHAAAANLNSAADALHLLDISPEKLAALEHSALTTSLNDRPRLVGGSLNTDQVVRAAPDGRPLATTRPVGANHRLNIDLTNPNHEAVQMVDVHSGNVVHQGHLTEVGNAGGFRITDPATGAFHQFDATGRLDGLTVADRNGGNLGDVHIDRANNQATLTRTGQPARTFTYRNVNGGHQLEMPDGTWQRFGDDGRLTHANIRIADHNGRIQQLEIDHGNNSALLGNGPNRTQWTYTPAPRNGVDFSIANAADHTWRDYGPGGLVGEGLPVRGNGVGNAAHAPVDHLVIDHTTRPLPTATYRGGDGTVWHFTRNPMGFQLTHSALGDNRWRQFDDLGGLTSEDIHVTDHAGANVDHLEIDYHGAQPQAHYPGEGAGGTRWNHTPVNGGGFRLTHQGGADTGWREFDGAGHLNTENFHVQDQTRAGHGNVQVDYRNNQATYTVGAATWHFTPHNGGGFRLDHATPGDGRSLTFDGGGRLTGEDMHVQLPGAANPSHLVLDHTNPQSTATHAGGDGTVWNFQRGPMGGFRLTHPTAGDGRWQQFDNVGNLTGQDVHLTDQFGANRSHLQITYGANPHAYEVGPGGPGGVRWNHTANANGFRLDHPAAGNGTWRQFDHTGRLSGQDVNALSHDGTAYGHVEFDYVNGHAFTPGANPAVRIQWDHAHDPNTGGFNLTHAGGNDRLTFDANNRLTVQHLDLHDAAGALTGNHVRADFTNPAAPNLILHDGTGAVAHTTVTQDAAGHYIVTDTTGGAHVTFEYSHVDGSIRAQHISLGDNLGTHVRADFTGPNPALDLRADRGNAAIGHFTVTRGATGDFHVGDTRPGRGNNDRVFSPTGAPVSERITILRPNGRPSGHYLNVDFQAAGGNIRWTRTDAVGTQIRPHDPALNTGYNVSGAAVRKGDGSLQLTGADKTPIYSREPLGNGHDLELFRGDNGMRYWHEFDDAGRVGGGTRHFSTEEGGVTSWDLGKWGQVIREYRTTTDGGLVRAERGPGGFTWTRFNANGDKLLDGRRDNGLTGWTDTYSANGRTQVVQQKWNTINWLPHAKHYREYGINVGANGVNTVKTTYKEISPQAKDTGSLDTLTNGHTLEFTRYAEQRPPDFLWKSPDSLDNPFAKGLSYPLGSKWGAVDFPHEGTILGDSRFQVFKWTERDPQAVGGGVTSQGVRTVTPDGSFSDFAGDGIFVRGAIKLDNGHTVEIGRDANGKWDTFALDANGGAPVNRTLNWRQLDAGKNVVATGTRHFNGKSWDDVLTHRADPANNNALTPLAGGDRVVRDVDPRGNVTHYLGDDATKPQYDAAQPPGLRTTLTGNENSITRNTMGQIVGRDDHWGDIGDGAGGTHGAAVNVLAQGDERVGRWTWLGTDGTSGIRVAGRNERWTGSWDDSFSDFTRNPANNTLQQVRDFRALDKGKSLKAEADNAGAWRSQKFDDKGSPIANTDAVRHWKQADGTFGAARPGGDRAVDWRDLDANNNIVREIKDGRVREYTNPGNLNAWKEFDHGGVWRERTETAPGSGLYLEKETFQKQWRVTDVHGNLLRYRGASGRVWERNAAGQWYLGNRWKQVGSEVERKGWMTDFRGANRRVREPNRREFVIQNGAEGAFRGGGSMIAQKVVLDFIQDYTIDVAANIIITGAVNNWDFSPADWGKILAGGAIKSGIKAGYNTLNETVLKGTRDGLRNVDGGKDFNRNPYNHDKHADNEWAGNENPPRWRATTYDYWVGTVGVGALGNFVSNAVTASAFGLGPDHIKATGWEAVKDGAIGASASLVDTLTVGAARTLFHQMSSGRWFHNGGLADITLQFGEKLLEKYLQDVLLNPAAHLKPEPPAVPVVPQPNGDQSQNGSGGSNSGQHHQSETPPA
jgi:hypothetical protein